MGEPTDEEIIEAFAHVRGHDTDSYDIAEAVKNIRALFRASLTRAEAERDALGEALHRAHATAADRAMVLDREADETSSAIKKMQGATAACIANDILAIANGLSRASGAQDDPPTGTGRSE